MTSNFTLHKWCTPAKYINSIEQSQLIDFQLLNFGNFFSPLSLQYLQLNYHIFFFIFQNLSYPFSKSPHTKIEIHHREIQKYYLFQIKLFVCYYNSDYSPVFAHFRFTGPAYCLCSILQLFSQKKVWTLWRKKNMVLCWVCWVWGFWCWFCDNWVSWGEWIIIVQRAVISSKCSINALLGEQGTKGCSIVAGGWWLVAKGWNKKDLYRTSEYENF